MPGTDPWHSVAGQEIAGGRSYDALILHCARKARATVLLTMDHTDFVRLDPGGIRVVVPA